MTKPLTATVILLSISIGLFGQNVKDVINKHILAYGGPKGIERAYSLKAIQTEEIMKQAGDVEMKVKKSIAFGNTNRSRYDSQTADMQTADMQFTEIVNGNEGWSLVTKKGNLLSRQPMDINRIQYIINTENINGYELIKAISKQSYFEVVSKEKLNQQDVFSLKFKKDNLIETYYVDQIRTI